MKHCKLGIVLRIGINDYECVGAGFLRFRWTDRELVREIRIPIFEITKTESAVLWPLVEKGLIESIALIPSGMNTKSVNFYF